jgi:hypothetical protein
MTRGIKNYAKNFKKLIVGALFFILIADSALKKNFFCIYLFLYIRYIYTSFIL